tara:strand:+ start:1289 stop:2092 length:804 start_codon:yes stop_codon:yes gene_type:complete
MDIDKDTARYISISKRPGSFGLDFHNQGYKHFGINAIYLPLKVPFDKHLESTISLVRNNFQGCSVSMPYKQEVIKHLDSLEYSAKNVMAVNTILNKNERLIGFNTDYDGAKKVLEGLGISGKKVLILGTGGVARAIGLAVKNLGGELTISGRSQTNSRNLSHLLNSDTLNWEEKEKNKGYLLINATSVGFYDKEKSPIDLSSVDNYECIMDVVIGDTKLIRESTSKGKKVVLGKSMAVHQAAKQFEIYTGRKLPKSFLKKYLGENLI